MATEAIAPAKINLCLHLTGLRDDGYHLLESLVAFTDFGDVIRVEPADRLQLTVTGPFANGVPTDDRNLVMKAARLLQRRHGVTQGAQISLHKELPHGGGIGGGSSDAAAALRLLAALWDVPVPGNADAAQLGADVPVCLHAPRPVIMRGIGEDIAPVALPQFWLVLVNAGAHVDTARAFAKYDQQHDFSPDGIDPLPENSCLDDFETWLLGQRNDFTKVIRQENMAPVVGEVLDMLWADPACRVAEMSGSGSTCWGMFASETEATASAERLQRQHPDWWIRVSAIR